MPPAERDGGYWEGGGGGGGGVAGGLQEMSDVELELVFWDGDTLRWFF